MSNSLINMSKGSLSPTGWDIRQGDLTQDEWLQVGHDLGQADKTFNTSLNWYYGDWLNAVPAKYGEWAKIYEDASKVTKLSVDRLRELKGIAESVQSEARASLPIKHHKAITKFRSSPEKQTHYLTLAQDNNWSAAKLREVIADDEKPKYACDDCDEIFDSPHWHCLKCNTHWLPNESCQNCIEKLKPEPDKSEGEFSPEAQFLIDRIKVAVKSKSEQPSPPESLSVKTENSDNENETSRNGNGIINKNDNGGGETSSNDNDIIPNNTPLEFQLKECIDNGLKSKNWNYITKAQDILKQMIYQSQT